MPADPSRFPAKPRRGTKRRSTPGSTAMSPQWLVDIGDHVKAGQSLAAIETPELDAELQRRESQAERGRRRSRGEAGASRFRRNDRTALAQFAQGRRFRPRARSQIRGQGGSDRRTQRVARAGRAPASRGRSADRADPVQGRQGAVRGDDRPPEHQHRRSRDRREAPRTLPRSIGCRATIRSGFSSMCRRASPRKSSPTARMWRSRTATIPLCGSKVR